MTAPTTRRTDAVKAEAATPPRTRPFMLTNEISVDILVTLLNEFLDQGALPAL